MKIETTPSASAVMSGACARNDTRRPSNTIAIMTIYSSLVFLLSFAAVTVSGDYVVQVRVYSYSNPTNWCTTCNNDRGPGCCDSWSHTECDGSDRCDTYFQFCLRPLGSSPVDKPCPANDDYPSVITPADADNNITIDFSNDVLGLSNPFTLTSYDEWRGIQLYVVAIDNDSETSDDVIDAITIDITTDTLLGVENVPIEYTGIHGLARMGLQYEVRCIENYYGEFCENLDECLLFTIQCAGLNVHCEDRVNGFTCVCNQGFIGDFCDFNVDDCEGVTCSGHGMCVDGINTFVCNCNPGFTGELCQTTIDYCNGVDCSGNGQCENRVNSFACSCNPGFMGDLCQATIDHCMGVDCTGNGQCENEMNSFTCNCNLGFTGDLCQTTIDYCNEVDCSGNGQCENRVNSFACGCNPGFTGDLCQTAIDYCNGVDCSGNGQCENTAGSSSCTCDPGFSGDLCQTNIDECVGVDCNGNGRCEDGVNDFSCICDPGFTGVLCQSNIDDCIGVNCSGHGTCEDGLNSYSCICNNGYAGRHCENTVTDDVCAKINCSGNGVCHAIDGTDAYGCVCFAGYYGEHCELHPTDESQGQDGQAPSLLTNSTNGNGQLGNGDSGVLSVRVLGVLGGVVALLALLCVVSIVVMCALVITRRKTNNNWQPRDAVMTTNSLYESSTTNSLAKIKTSVNVGYGVVGIHSNSASTAGTDNGRDFNNRRGSRRDGVYINPSLHNPSPYYDSVL